MLSDFAAFDYYEVWVVGGKNLENSKASKWYLWKKKQPE